MLLKAWNSNETLFLKDGMGGGFRGNYLIRGLVPLDPRGDKGDNINLPAVAGREVPRGSS